MSFLVVLGSIFMMRVHDIKIVQFSCWFTGFWLIYNHTCHSNIPEFNIDIQLWIMTHDPVLPAQLKLWVKAAGRIFFSFFWSSLLGVMGGSLWAKSHLGNDETLGSYTAVRIPRKAFGSAVRISMTEINTKAGRLPAFCRFLYLHYAPDPFVSGLVGALETTGTNK